MKTSFAKGVARAVHYLTDDALLDLLPQRRSSAAPRVLGAFALGALAGFAGSFALADADREKIRKVVKENLSNMIGLIGGLFGKDGEMVENEIKKTKDVIHKVNVGDAAVSDEAEIHDN